MFDSNIHDFSHVPVDSSASIGAPAAPSGEVSTGPDTGTSSIEKSKNVLAAYVPALNFPILSMPTNDGTLLISMASALASHRDLKAIEVLLMSAQLKNDEAINSMLDKWIENLRAIDEETKKRINSQDYIVKEQIRLHGTPISSNAITTLDQILSHKIDDDSGQAGKMVKETMMMLAVVAGGIAMASVSQVSAEGSVSGYFANSPELISKIDPTLATNMVTDTIVMINLMVAPLIYFGAWDAAVGNVAEKGNKANMQLAEDFAREMITLIGNPVLLQGILRKVPGTEALTPQQNSQFMKTLMLVLALNALSVLYIAEAGKVSPQELASMIKGEMSVPADSQKATLLTMVKGALGDLSPDARSRALEAIFEYVDSEPTFKKMFDPAAVFQNILASSAFNPKQDLEQSAA